MNNLNDEKMDKFIKNEFQKDINISAKANSIFENFNPELCTKEKSLDEKDKKGNTKFYRKINRVLSVAAVSLSVVLVGSAALYFNKNVKNNPNTQSNSNNSQEENILYNQKYIIKNEPLQIANEEVIKEIENRFTKVYIIGKQDVAIQLKSKYWNEFDSEFTSDSSYKIENINKEVSDAFIGYTGGSGLPYVFILMKDGTAEYVDLHCLNRNEFLFSATAIEGLQDVVGFEQKTRKYSYSNQEYEYVNAIRNDGKKKEIEIGVNNNWDDTSTKTFDKLNEKYIKAHNKEAILDDNKGDYTVDGITYLQVNGEKNFVYYFKNSKFYRVERSTVKEECIAEGVGGMMRDNKDGRITVCLTDKYVIFSLDNNIIYKDRSNNIISKVTDNTANIQGNQNIQKDFSFMSQFKNTIYKSDTKSEGDWYEIRFDSNAKPTIKMGERSTEVVETYLQTKEYSNIKVDVAAGSTYVTFDFIAQSQAEDISGNGMIRYSNVSDNSNIEVQLISKWPSGQGDQHTQRLTVKKCNVEGKEFTNMNGRKITLYGKKFLTFYGTSSRNIVYYINENNTLCKMNVDTVTESYLAENVKNITANLNECKIYAESSKYDFTAENIIEQDNNVVYTNLKK